jgi:hypothetical protein
MDASQGSTQAVACKDTLFFPGRKQRLMKNEPVREGTLVSPREVAKPIRRVFVPGFAAR